MKLLHIGLCVDYKNEGLPFALNKASDFYHEISTGEKDLNDKINHAIDKHKFDVAFFQIQASNIVHPFTFQKIKDKGIFTVNWSGDIRRNTEQWYYQTNADLTLFSNLRDVDNLRKHNLKSDFLQIGIDPKVFTRHGIKRDHKKVIFMGNNYGNQFPLSQERRNLVAFLMSHGYSVYGTYPGVTGNVNGNQLEESIIYNNCDIAINHSQFNEPRYTSDRMFRILASGCMCLSHHYKGIETDFRIGLDLETYRDINELKRKINHYLANDAERQKIAESGYQLAHTKFTYKQMVENLFELVKKYR